MDYHQLPKIELHLHLDCSLSYKVVQQIDPAVSYEDYCHSFIAPARCTDLVDYLTRAVKGFELMQTKEQLRLVTLDLFEQLKADNVIYAEIRFAPLLHLEKGLTPVEVVETVNAAFTEGKAMTGMEGGLILCTLRHYNEEQSMETVQLVQQFKGTNVLAFDMAGDEAGYPVTAHVKAFQFANEHGIHCTCHGGEAKGPESVWETLEHFHPTRIGHGVRSAEDKQLLDHLVKKDIHLEVCPTSNIQTNIFPAIEEHAADKIYRHGVSMSINTDARTVTPVTLSGEYNKLQDTFHWTNEHFLRCNLEGIRHSFTTEAVKQKIATQIQEAYNKR
ncbi:MAG TPA: adenosine deaminase [Chitinophagaceae bacterium]|nr:adenosine deaminase [Chitinophagaceae bacterium]HPH33636.1 adenosine deaminase [Chitinophagaceae bacterium]